MLAKIFKSDKGLRVTHIGHPETKLPFKGWGIQRMAESKASLKYIRLGTLDTFLKILAVDYL